MSNLSKESMRILLVALKNVSKRPAYAGVGICENLQIELERLDAVYPYLLSEEIARVFPQWSKFSGDTVFPVPAPWPSLAAPLQIYLGTPNKWEGEYGALRYELLNFLITEFEKQLDRP